MVNRQPMPPNWGPRNQSGPFPQSMYEPMRNMHMYPTYPSMQMQRSGPFRQRGQMGAFGQNQSRGGGLLAKLFGRNTPQMPRMGGGGFLGGAPSATRAVASGTAASGGSFLQTLTNPTAISGFLNNTQQVLNAIQQISPLVSQYGPIVKNLPAMWKLYRGLKDATSTTNDEDQVESTIEIEESTTMTEIDESSEFESSILIESSSSSDQDTTTGKYSQKHRSRNTSSEEEDEASDALNSNNSNELKERRSFPRMYI